MKTFIFTCNTNYGEFVTVVHASSKKEAENLFHKHQNPENKEDFDKSFYMGYSIFEIDPNLEGISFDGGGDYHGFNAVRRKK